MDENKEILPNIKNIKSQESYTLPSKGLVYKPEDNIPASITLRRMTTKEEKMRFEDWLERKQGVMGCHCSSRFLTVDLLML